MFYCCIQGKTSNNSYTSSTLRSRQKPSSPVIDAVSSARYYRQRSRESRTSARGPVCEYEVGLDYNGREPSF